MEKPTRKTILPIALLAATLLIGCQLPFQTVTKGEPWAVVNIGSLKFERNASLAIVLKFENDKLATQALESHGVYRVQVSITSPSLAQPLVKEITQSDFYAGKAVFNFGNIPPGKVSVKVNAFDASGGLIQWANGEAVIVPNQTSSLTLYCNTATGDLEIIYDCPDCPSPTPSPAPSYVPGETVSTYILPERPAFVAIDSQGNPWVTMDSINQVWKFSPHTGTYEKYPVGNSPAGIAIDRFDNVYIANYGSNNISKLLPSGESTATFSLTPTSVNHSPFGVAVDRNTGMVWVANDTYNHINTISSSGDIEHHLLSAQTTVKSNSVALDSAGNAYFSATDESDPTINRLTKFHFNGTMEDIANVGRNPIGVVVDSHDNAWVANHGILAGPRPDSVSMVASSSLSTVVSYAANPMPYWLAIDSKNNIYATNYYSDMVTKLNAERTDIATYSTGVNPQGIAIDQKGFIWVTCAGDPFELRKIAP